MYSFDLRKQADAFIEKHGISCILPTSDVLHLLKRARTRILNHPVAADPDVGPIDINIIAQHFQLGSVFSDKTQFGKICEAYALKLFSWDTLMKCIPNEDTHFLTYAFPFILLTQAIKSPILTKEARIAFLENALQGFLWHWQVISNNKNALYVEKYRDEQCWDTLHTPSPFPSLRKRKDSGDIFHFLACPSV